ncbi:SIR2 family protein [Clostridiaceae bacterium 35-E11]
MEFTHEINSFIEDYIKCIKEDCAAIFAGAGLSASCGHVDWKDLLRTPARRIGLDVDKETDLVTLAQYIYNKDRSKQPMAELIKNSFVSSNNINENHKILAELPIRTYWTTNYDSLIESGLIHIGKKPDVKRSVNDLSTIINKRDAIVYKMHGDISNARDVVLIKDDYELYELKNQLFSINLKRDLISKTFLFIGFSFEDPNLEYILSKIRILMDGHSRKHYCFFRKIKRSKYADNREGEKEFQYHKLKQELKCADLERYSIQSILVDEYSDITEILRKIETGYKRSHVLISGSADDYKEFKIEDVDPLDFIHKLSGAISKSDCKIVTGVGKGIGSAVLNGVLDYIYKTNTRKLDDHIIMRPFPLYETGHEDFEETKREYRKQMVKLGGIAVFVLGNKLDDGDIQIADGVLEEFDMAIENKLNVVPIGVTGYASKILWDKVMGNFEQYYPDNMELKEEFELLGKEELTSDEIIKTTCKIINKLKEVY